MVACHGNFGAFQDVDLLIELAQRVLSGDERIELLIIGRGPGRLKIEEALRSFVVAGRVDIRAEVGHEEMRRLLSAADLGLSLRRNDAVSRHSFPVRVTDYLSLGLPVVVTPLSEAGGVAERIGVGHEFPNSDPSRIARHRMSSIRVER